MAVLLAVILLHAPLLLVSVGPRRSLVRGSPADVVWLQLTEPERRVKPLPLQAPQTTPRAVSAAPPRTEDIQPLTIRASRVPVDWDANADLAARSAIDAVVREESYRSFGFPRKRELPGEEEPPSIFEEPGHEFGEEGIDAFGKPVVWLSKRCYQELDRSDDPLRDRRTMCILGVGKREPRGDLFDHIKKRKPEQ